MFPNHADNSVMLDRLNQLIDLAEDGVTPLLSDIFGGMIGSIDAGLGVCGWVGNELRNGLNSLINIASRRISRVQSKIAEQIAEIKKEQSESGNVSLSVGEPCAKPLDEKVVLTDDCPPGTPGICEEFPIMCDPGIPPGDGPMPPDNGLPPKPEPGCPGGVCPKPEPEPEPNPRFICRFDPKTGKRILFDPIGFVCKDEETGKIIDCPPNIGSLEDCPPKDKPKPDDKCCPPSPINVDISLPDQPPPVVVTQPVIIDKEPAEPEQCTDNAECHFRPKQEDVSYYGIVQVPDSNCHSESIYSDCGRRQLRIGTSKYVKANEFRRMIESDGANAGFDWSGARRISLSVSISNGIPNDE